jgi:hypothetical protein
MMQIVLSDEQAQAIRNATGPVELRDQEGKLLGHVPRPFTSERIADARRRAESDGPWYTTQQVLEHLASLDRK